MASYSSVRLIDRFPDIERQMALRISREVKNTANQIAADAKSRVPLGPPPVHLRDRIHVERQGVAAYAVIAGDEEAWYGHLIENGTATQPAQPFLIPAAEAQTAAAIARVEAILRSL